MKSLILVSIKTIIFILPVLFTTLFSCSNDKQAIKFNNSLDEIGLKGKVRSVIETEYDANEKLGEIQKGDLLRKTIHRFNEVGNYIEQTVYKDDGSQPSRTTYAYDNNCKVTEMIEYIFEKLERRVNYIYDNNGNEIERNVYKPDNSLSSRTITKYNKNSIKIEENHYKPDGRLESKILFRYDDKGNEVESIVYHSDGSIFIKSSCKYDERGQMIERTSSMHPIMKSKYDINENLKSALEYSKEDDFTFDVKEHFKYDDTGKVVEEINIIQGDVRKAAYKYDKYDQFGNWLYKFKEDELMNNSSPMSVTERVIEYY